MKLMPRESVYDSTAVANYLIQKAHPHGLDSLQVLKLVYIAHGFSLALHDKPLIEDDVEAWQYGPVIRRLYKFLPPGATRATAPITDAQPDFEPADQALLDEVYEKYGSLSGLHLSSLTHRPNSPWDKTWKAYGKNAVIPRNLIQQHYKQVVENYKAAVAAGKQYSPEAL